MDDPWVVDTRKWSEENGEGRNPLPKAKTALKYMIRHDRGVQWRSMAGHDTGSTRSSKIKYKGYMTLEKGADHSRGNEVMESYGMIGINLGLVHDWLRAMKKSKTD
ncbi:Uncharacterized protein Rs2_35770 [Raphanus sativus]|nr:Uncharacterized protein Rs2_35770 [Raphanus sativus]